MRLAFHICASAIFILGLCTGPVEAGQAKAKTPAAPKAPANPNKGGSNKAEKKASGKQAGPVPAEQLQRLLEMPPDQREKALSNAKLNPAQRERLEKQLNNLDSMTPEARARRLDQIGRLEKLPPGRRQAVNQEIQGMRSLTVRERRDRMHSPEFNQQYSPEEQQLIRETFPNAAKDR